MRPILALLLTASIAAAENQYLLLPVDDSGKMLRLQLAIGVEGQAPDANHEAFLDKLFNYFDRDADGSLSGEEAARVFPLPGINGRPNRLDLVKGGKACSRAEFMRRCRMAFPAVAVVRSPASVDLAKANANLLRRLDRDGDGRLSRAELNLAPRVLRALDVDEDETLTLAELVSDPKGIAVEAKGSSNVAWSTSRTPVEAAGVLSVDLKKEPQPPQLRKVAAQSFQAVANVQNTFSYSGGMIQLAKLDGDPLPRIQATREFYLTPFKSALGDKAFVDGKQIEDDASLVFLGPVFSCADRNDDGRLTLKELEAFLDLIDAGIRARVVVTLNDEGRSLIALLDENRDMKLDRRELARAPRILSKDADSLVPGDIPRRLALSISLGVTAREFGPALLVGQRSTATAKGTPNRDGPKWFLAMDRNGDGFVSPQEFLGPLEVFAALDSDGDGFISMAEAKAARQ